MAVSSDVKLRIWNEALRLLKARELASVSENHESARVLASAWGSADEAATRALARADWNFALRSAESAYDASLESGFGFQYAHNKPTDMARLSGLSADPYFRFPLTALQYAEEAGRWLSDHDALYIRYVSNGDAYGLDSSLWPEDFIAYLAAFLAFQIGGRIGGSDNDREYAQRLMKSTLREAKSVDSMNEGVKFPPRGSWVMARGSNGRER